MTRTTKYFREKQTRTASAGVRGAAPSRFVPNRNNNGSVTVTVVVNNAACAACGSPLTRSRKENKKRRKLARRRRRALCALRVFSSFPAGRTRLAVTSRRHTERIVRDEFACVAGERTRGNSRRGTLCGSHGFFFFFSFFFVMTLGPSCTSF